MARIWWVEGAHEPQTYRSNCLMWALSVPYRYRNIDNTITMASGVHDGKSTLPGELPLQTHTQVCLPTTPSVGVHL